MVIVSLLTSGMWDGERIRPSAQKDLKSIGQILKNALEPRQRDGKFAIAIKARTDTQRVSDLSDSLVVLWKKIGLTQNHYELLSREREGGKFQIATIDSNLRKEVENANRRVEVKIIPKFSELEPFYRSKLKKTTDF